MTFQRRVTEAQLLHQEAETGQESLELITTLNRLKPAGDYVGAKEEARKASAAITARVKKLDGEIERAVGAWLKSQKNVGLKFARLEVSVDTNFSELRPSKSFKTVETGATELTDGKQWKALVKRTVELGAEIFEIATSETQFRKELHQWFFQYSSQKQRLLATKKLDSKELFALLQGKAGAVLGHDPGRDHAPAAKPAAKPGAAPSLAEQLQAKKQEIMAKKAQAPAAPVVDKAEAAKLETAVERAGEALKKYTDATGQGEKARLNSFKVIDALLKLAKRDKELTSDTKIVPLLTEMRKAVGALDRDFTNASAVADKMAPLLTEAGIIRDEKPLLADLLKLPPFLPKATRIRDQAKNITTIYKDLA